MRTIKCQQVHELFLYVLRKGRSLYPSIRAKHSDTAWSYSQLCERCGSRGSERIDWSVTPRSLISVFGRNLLPSSLTLKMAATGFPEMLVTIHHTIRLHIPDCWNGRYIWIPSGATVWFESKLFCCGGYINLSSSAWKLVRIPPP
jgi:hypothetical protein